MPKIKLKVLITSLTINALFLVGGAWVLNEKGGISYLQLKFSERERGPFVASPYNIRKRNSFRAMSEHLPQGGIALVGDSLTEVGPWTELLPKTRIRNRGIRGDTTRGLLHRLTEIIQAKPERIFILIGINDLKARVPAQEIAANYAKILDQLITGCPKAKIYPQSVLPTHNDLFAANYEEVENLNEKIKGLANIRKLTYVDLYPHFTIHGNQPNSVYFSDGLHLTVKGYLRWIQFLTPYLSETK